MHHLLYVTNARIPTERAHGLQIIKMCEAFQRQGAHVELIVPWRMQSPAMKQVQNLWDHYQVDTPFRVRHLPALDFVRLAHLLPARLMMALYYAQCSIFSILAGTLTCFRRNAIYYSRDLQTVFFLCLTKPLHRKRIFFEAHELHGAGEKTGLLGRVAHAGMHWMLRKIDGLIVITQRLKALYAEMGACGDRILVAPDGIDAKRLTGGSIEKSEARKHLGIPLDKKIVCYTGHLFAWKGVFTLAESGRDLPEDYRIYLVGGLHADIRAMRQYVRHHQLNNVQITGYVPYADIPWYLAAADVLALPNSATAQISRECTSPLKMFEYMGAQRPIVASDLPSIREVLRHRDNAYLVEPDAPEALAAGILHVVRHPLPAQAMVATAYTEAANYTWDQRAAAIQAFIGPRISCRNGTQP